MYLQYRCYQEVTVMRFFRGLFKSGKFYLCLFAVTFSFVFGKGIFDFIMFPDELRVIAGEEQSFEFNVPVAATISTKDDASVNINQKRLTESVSVELDKPLYVWSDSECTMDMKLSFMGIPMKDVKVSVLPHIKLIPCGKTVGVKIETDGILVLAQGEVKDAQGGEYVPCDGKIYEGDILLKANGKELGSKEDLIDIVENSSGTVHFDGLRDKKSFSADVSPIIDGESEKRKIGVWVRDSTQGIGTVTFIDKNTGKFAALGHGITDVDTKQIMKVKTGEIMSSAISAVKKGESGTPGELLGDIDRENVIGQILSNNEYGIFGKCQKQFFDGEEMPVGLQNEVVEGSAYILSNIDGDKVEKFEINIDSVNRYNTDNSKGMVIRITDKRLLEKTNGIVQGMSGSPIIQNGKIIGAVTHVFVRNPAKGYGIFIENMLSKCQ